MALSGCFSERSHPFRSRDLVPLRLAANSVPPDTRRWLAVTHAQLQDLLPKSRSPALTTAELTDAQSNTVDVASHFGRPFEVQNSVFRNFRGMMHTAQMASTKPHSPQPPPAWSGFNDLWIPVGGSLELAGRMGLATATDGTPQKADCIVILPGLLGNNHVLRTRDLALALRDNGFHVLALELRGSGQTETRFPDVTTCWGVLEATDLLKVSEWLADRPEVQRTGIIGFCWGANLALLAAWADGRPPDHPSITPRLRPIVAGAADRPHFTAGILAFSPVLQFEGLIEALEEPRSALTEPVLRAFQLAVIDRQESKGHHPVDGRLHTLIHQEAHRYDFAYPELVPDGLRYLRLLPFGDKPSGDKLEDARVPVLIVRAANDPVVPAQHLADLVARTHNPNVAALVLPGGGHVGFAAYARSYYFSLIFNFFDASRGPQARPLPADAVTLGPAAEEQG